MLIISHHHKIYLNPQEQQQWKQPVRSGYGWEFIIPEIWTITMWRQLSMAYQLTPLRECLWHLCSWGHPPENSWKISSWKRWKRNFKGKNLRLFLLEDLFSGFIFIFYVHHLWFQIIQILDKSPNRDIQGRAISLPWLDVFLGTSRPYSGTLITHTGIHWHKRIIYGKFSSWFIGWTTQWYISWVIFLDDSTWI